MRGIANIHIVNFTLGSSKIEDRQVISGLLMLDSDLKETDGRGKNASLG